MYDEAWYNAFVPSSAPQTERKGHKRRQSLLQQPNEGNKADDVPVEVVPEIAEEVEKLAGPPSATIARRAKSYSDFYEVVRDQVKKEHRLERSRKKSRQDIRTELQLSDWYGGKKDALLDASHEEYKDQLHQSRSHLDSLLDKTTSTLEQLSILSDSFRAVETQTTAFQARCENLLTEQKRLSGIADDVTDNLRYYSYLEPITRRLNAPGAGNYVRGQEYSDMLATLDECLEYMQAHPNHREAQTYRSRYRLLLTRALTLIRVHFTNSLREIAADVSKRIADRQLNDTTMSALLYAKFRTGAPELKRIGQEIHDRAVPSPEVDAGGEAEYQSLVNELYQSYSTTRGRLILPLVIKKMNEISLTPSSSKDVVAFARSSISYVRSICMDEYDLWMEWFPTEEGLNDFLESICEPLYDHLRPRTIHETQILRLCELCTLIQTRYMHDEDDDTSPVDTHRLDFAALIQPALEDAQTRLVFLALNILRNDIEFYKPKPADLDYPARFRKNSVSSSRNGQPALSGRKSSNAGIKDPTIVESENVENDNDPQLQIVESHAWYPTLTKATWLLSRIYRLVNSTVFDDLAHQIVHQTTLSLHTAASALRFRPSASADDAALFLLAHLLHLKQRIVAFDIEFVQNPPDPSLDFSSLTSTFAELRQARGAALFQPAAWLRLLRRGTLLPRLVATMLDAKTELDGRLRAVVNEFVREVAARMTAPLGKLPPVEAKGKEEKRGRKDGGEGGGDALAAAQAVRAVTEREVRTLRAELEAYLEDGRTRETLVGAVQDQVVERYEEWYEGYVVAQGRANGKVARKKGKGREDEVWDADAFAAWSEDVFKVGRMLMRDDEDDDDGRSRSVSRHGSI
ncbi:MAG: Golgi transport complex subunit 3 [Bathelium mastoideum]|nr:MAG: Golgi transport complex subunit 3 [Bathelium mastoideum]